MATLNLHIITRQDGTGRVVTQTCIGKKKGNDKIAFLNDSNAALTVAFNPPNVMHNAHGQPVPSINVPAGQSVEVNFDSGKPKGTQVKYTATVAGAAPEDPIVIID